MTIVAILSHVWAVIPMTNPMLEKAHDTIKIMRITASGFSNGIPTMKIPRSMTRIPLTNPLTAPPMIKATASSTLLRGVISMS